MISKYIYINIKRYLKNPTMITMVVALPIIVVIGMNFLLTSEHGLKIIAVDNDKTKVSQEFLEDLNKEFDIEITTDKELGNPDFESGSAGVLMTLDKGYEEAILKGELPSVKIKELKESQNNRLLAIEIDSAIKLDVQKEKFYDYKGNYIETQVVQKDKLKMGLIIGLVISYYVFIGSTVITNDILEMKNNNILKRAISTANKNYKIMIGLFVGSFVFLGLSAVVSFVVSKKMSSLLDDVTMLNGIVAMVLISLFSISLTVFFVRWFKNKDIIANVGTFSSFVLFSLGIFMIQAPYISESMAKYEVIGYISPYYWVGRILNGDLIEGSIILLLMSVAIFTCGTYKLREFTTN